MNMMFSMVDAGAKARAADLLVLIGGLRRKVNPPFPPGRGAGPRRRDRAPHQGSRATGTNGPPSRGYPGHDIASRSSSLRWPGTMATGIGNVPAVLPMLETSG